MENIDNLTIYTSDAHGKWVAATGRAPYFCFEAETEVAALALATAAIKFYRTAVLCADKPFKTESFNPKNRVLASELVAA